MPKINPIHWKKFEKFLLFVGCELIRERGDHRMYARAGLLRPVVMPKNTAVPVFVIRNNLRVLGISHEQYLDILGRM